MTNVEALLNVEKGFVPHGVEVFQERNPDLPRQRAWLGLCAFLGLVALVLRVQGAEPLGVLVVAIFAAMAAVMAIPTHDEEPRKPRLLLLCDKGIIAREHWGLRNWRYDELVRVWVVFVDGQQQLCVEDAAGDAHLIDHLNFKNGQRLRGLLEQRIRRPV